MQSPKQNYVQTRLFQSVDMEDIVPDHHILRKLKDVMDFSHVHEWVKPLYAQRMGRPSMRAELVVRLVVLEYFFDHSERELFNLLPMHAGYLWFCGLDFESSLPDRTTLVKTRALWRRHGIFEQVMMHVVDQCIASGLVRPDVHAGADGTQVRANASIHSLKERELAPVQTIEDYLADLEEKDEQTLEPSKETNDDDDDQPPSSHPHGDKSSGELEEQAHHEDFHGKTFSNQTHRSTTDPDARLYRKSKGQETYLRYLVHNLTDTASGVILDTDASVASGTAEREVTLQQLASMRFKHPHIRIQTLSVDKAYGTSDFLASLFSQSILPLVSLRNHQLEAIPSWQRKTYDPERLRKRQAKVDKVRVTNRAKCIQIQGKYRIIQNKRSQCEHGFAEAKTVHGLDRARSRGVDCMQEQALCTAIVQNLKKLCRFKGKRPKTGISVCHQPRKRNEKDCQTSAISRLFPFIRLATLTSERKMLSFSPVF
ncbi:transposase [Salicibibacter kimchii]|uniref:IS5/IS1182 family transposase n=1 Tax=Salicibibacter kimchii TaxID=2099786 RepID=A0A345C0W1_9BACI|nr:IS5/IS1182 family transposase [Salicibibacter kimchii]